MHKIIYIAIDIQKHEGKGWRVLKGTKDEY